MEVSISRRETLVTSLVSYKSVRENRDKSPVKFGTAPDLAAKTKRENAVPEGTVYV